MRNRSRISGRTAGAALAVILVAAWAGWTVHGQQPTSTGVRPPVTKAQADAWMTSNSNWGKWGKDDQLGSLNYITPAKRQQAAALVKAGIVVSMERPIAIVPRHDEIKRDGKPNGLSFYEMTFRTFPKGDPRGNEDFNSDVQSFAPHGAGLTHLDALCHYSDGKGHMYNGFSLTGMVSQEVGCTKLGLDSLKEGIVTRGVLVDMTRLQAPHTPGAPAYREDIEAWEKQAHVTVAPGDALFIYNPRPPAAPGAAPGSPQALRGGVDLSVLPFLKERGVALTSGISSIPDDTHADHRLTIVAAGIFLLDSPDLVPLAETAARLGRWEFMLTIAAPRAPGATGYPVNPLAMF
jgi:hypothetical protein